MMKDFISEQEARRHYFVHLKALLMLFTAHWLPPAFVKLAGIVFTISALYLFANLLSAFVLFRKEQRKLSA